MKKIKIMLFIGMILMFSNCSKEEGNCCRTCSTGKACGDSCIADTATCNEDPGCACDGGGTVSY